MLHYIGTEIHNACTCLLLDVSEMLMQGFFNHFGSWYQLMKFTCSDDEFVPCRVGLAVAYFSSCSQISEMLRSLLYVNVHV